MVSRYPVTTTKCNLCGIEFPIKPSRLNRSKLNFCSDACLRKKNTLVGWIVRCNRKFQDACTPNPIRDEWISLLRGFERTDWRKRYSDNEKKRWDAKLASMMGANRHRESIAVGKSKYVTKAKTWRKTLYLISTVKPAKTLWEKKLANWLTNQKKRLRKKSASQQ